MVRNYFLAAALWMMSVSCVTATPALRAQEFKSIPPHASGLIVSAEVLGGQDARQCRMEFNDSLGKSNRLFFEPGGDLYFTELKPGHYQVTRLACEHGSFYVEGQPYWSRFVINEGEISFFEPLKFNPPSDKVLIRHPDRSETLAAFKQTREALSARDRDRLVDAQNGRYLDEKMQDIQKVVLFHFSESQNDGYETFRNTIMNCEQKEMNENHVLLGKVEYQLTYRKGKLEKMSGGSHGNSTFSEPFFDCVEKAFHEFKPKVRGQLNVTVTL